MNERVRKKERKRQRERERERNGKVRLGVLSIVDHYRSMTPYTIVSPLQAAVYDVLHEYGELL